MNLSNASERNSRLGLAHAKNKSEESKMSLELEKLEKEKEIELRMLRNVKKKFRTKYSSNSNNDLEFNYEKNNSGDVISTAMPEENFKQIHNLIFSNNGQIDIEKILCLHLLSAHRAETLTPPKKKLVYVCKMHSPVEKLLEKSKKKYTMKFEHSFVNALPLYSVELSEFGTEFEKNTPLINDGRLASRILLNIPFRALVNSVLSALNQSNPDKKQEIIEFAKDPERLREIFKSKKILHFINELSNYPVLKNCDSYVLSAPFRVKTIQLEIKTRDLELEELIKSIRQNVLQIPPRTLLTLPEEVLNKNENRQKKPHPNIIYFRRKMNRRRSDRQNSSISGSLGSSNSTLDSLRKLSSSNNDSSERRIFRYERKNFIKRNIEAAGLTKRISPDYDTDEEEDYYFHPKKSSKDFKKPKRQPSNVKSHLAQVIEEKHLEEEANMSQSSEKEQERDELTSFHLAYKEDQSVQTPKISKKKTVPLYIKHTTCPACAEKWRQPRPTPKTPRIDKSKAIPVLTEENPYLHTSTQNRISSLINKELFKLESHDRKYSNAVQTYRRTNTKKKELDVTESDSWNLSPMDRAKIEQEIREKETKLKLQKFIKDLTQGVQNKIV